MTVSKIAVLYLRVSTELQAEQGTSLATQELVCLRKAQELGARVVDIVRDEGISGARYHTRDGIQKAVRYIETGEANMLIVAKLDRAGRDVDALHDIRKRVNRTGEMVFADGLSFDNNATGNFSYSIQAAVAQLERDTITERTAAGSRRRAEQGKQPCGSRAPFGYHVIQHADVIRGTHTTEQVGTYEVDEKQAGYARDIFARFASGTSLRRLAEWLNIQGVAPNKGGKAWHASSLHDIIKNTVYVGRAVWRREVSMTDESRIEQGFTSIKYRRVAPEGETVFIPAPRLVSDEVWERCQSQFARNRELQSGNPGRRYMLSGLARCPVCGSRMSAKRGSRYTYYRCKVAKNSGQCVNKCYRADVVEPMVTDFVEQMASNPELLINAADAFDRVEASGQARDGMREKLQGDLDSLNKREQATVQAQIAGVVAGASVYAYDATFAEIASTRAQIEKQIDNLPKEEDKVVRPSARTIAEKATQILKDVHMVLNASDVSEVEKNQLLSRIIEMVKPNEEGAEITLLPNPNTVLSVRTGVGVRGAQYQTLFESRTQGSFC